MKKVLIAFLVILVGAGAFALFSKLQNDDPPFKSYELKYDFSTGLVTADWTPKNNGFEVKEIYLVANTGEVHKFVLISPAGSKTPIFKWEKISTMPLAVVEVKEQ